MSVRMKTGILWGALVVVLPCVSWLLAGSVGLALVVIAALPVAVLAAATVRGGQTADGETPVRVNGKDVTVRGVPVAIRKTTKVTALGLAGVWVLTSAGLYGVFALLWLSADGLQ